MHTFTALREPNVTALRDVRYRAKGSSLGHNAFLFSILGFLLFFPLCVVGIGYAFASLGREEEGHGEAIAALVIGFLGLVIWIVVLALVFSNLPHPVRRF
jgi:O-antigen/teichoic acid export membrane protein